MAFLFGALTGAFAENRRKKHKAKKYAYEQSLYGTPYNQPYYTSGYYGNTGYYYPAGTSYYYPSSTAYTTGYTTAQPVLTSTGSSYPLTSDYLSRSGNIVYQSQAPQLIQPATTATTIPQYSQSYVAPGHTVARSTMVSPPIVTSTTQQQTLL